MDQLFSELTAAVAQQPHMDIDSTNMSKRVRLQNGSIVRVNLSVKIVSPPTIRKLHKFSNL
jgi:hypothetical protein